MFTILRRWAGNNSKPTGVVLGSMSRLTYRLLVTVRVNNAASTVFQLAALRKVMAFAVAHPVDEFMRSQSPVLSIPMEPPAACNFPSVASAYHCSTPAPNAL